MIVQEDSQKTYLLENEQEWAQDFLARWKPLHEYWVVMSKRVKHSATPGRSNAWMYFHPSELEMAQTVYPCDRCRYDAVCTKACQALRVYMDHNNSIGGDYE